jgi:dihydropteroate synthase
MNALEWKTSRRSLVLGERTFIMGILNVTPDSFSDGGRYSSPDRALAHAEEMMRAGADILDVGGESTRPGADAVAVDEELRRVIPVIERLASNYEFPISVDTTRAEVARRAIDAGAEIINDISGLRFDPRLADAAAETRAGLVLMHSRGERDTMHQLPPVRDILAEVEAGLRQSIEEAERRGVAREAIVLDPGIGFSKSQKQNLELVARLDRLAGLFPEFPLLVGTSRKSFIGHLLKGAPASERLHGTMASVTAAVLKGAHIVRVHDVGPARETLLVADALKAASG